MTIANEIFTPLYWKLQKAFPLRAIRNKKDAEAARKVLNAHFKERYTDRGEETYALALSDCLEAYESEQESREPDVDGVAMLKYYMESNRISQGQLADILDISQALVSQILGGSRQITAEHARRLGKRFSTNPGVFL
jgi:HTH-type transcriptional regulator / antitoxin HigA